LKTHPDTTKAEIVAKVKEGIAARSISALPSFWMPSSWAKWDDEVAKARISRPEARLQEPSSRKLTRGRQWKLAAAHICGLVLLARMQPTLLPPQRSNGGVEPVTIQCMGMSSGCGEIGGIKALGYPTPMTLDDAG
jgi:hypothetical protein